MPYMEHLGIMGFLSLLGFACFFEIWNPSEPKKISWQPLGHLLKDKLLVGPTCKIPLNSKERLGITLRSPKMCQDMIPFDGDWLHDDDFHPMGSGMMLCTSKLMGYLEDHPI